MSHRGELTERMLHLPLLLAERRHSQQELADIFKVKTRTIRRDIDTLSRYYPIVDERDGRAVIYRFSDDYRYHPPPLTPIELATLVLAQESIASTGLTALARLSHVMATRCWQRSGLRFILWCATNSMR